MEPIIDIKSALNGLQGSLILYCIYVIWGCLLIIIIIII